MVFVILLSFGRQSYTLFVWRISLYLLIYCAFMHTVRTLNFAFWGGLNNNKIINYLLSIILI